MDSQSVEFANDDFAYAADSLKRADDKVGLYREVFRDNDDELKEWKQANPCVSEENHLEKLEKEKRELTDRLHVPKDRLEEMDCNLEEMDCHLEEARTYNLQLDQTYRQFVSSDTRSHELFREMIAIQRQQQCSLEEIKQALISLSNKISSSSFKEGALGAVAAVKKVNRPNIVSSLIGRLLTHADNLNPGDFKRDEILENFFDWMTGDQGKHRYLLLKSPAASGKTCLLDMFRRKYPQLNVHYISMKSESDPYDCLLRLGLDIKRRTCRYKQVIYILDDAQDGFGHPTFWDMLIKDVPLHFGAGVRFIISATHMISTRGQSSPAHFEELKKFSHTDMLLSSEQALELLNSQPPLGLPTYMQNFSQLKGIIVEHCNGLVGALCKSVLFFEDNFRIDTPTEEKSVQAYFSKTLLDQMTRCFGEVHKSHIPAEANDVLLKCVLGKPINSIYQGYSGIMESFEKAGILTMDENKHYGFSSVLAKRYFTHCYFPNRAFSNPSTLRELVVKAIESMSANSLMLSTSNPKDFPKEATFQHLFMIGLLSNTRYDTAICPELSRSFDAKHTETTDKGEIDFFVDGNLMWGIELVRLGNRIGEHVSRFSQNGKYASLMSNDYVVLDFRHSMTRTKLHPSKRATAFFDVDEAGSTCFNKVTLQYEGEKPLILHLQP